MKYIFYFIFIFIFIVALVCLSAIFLDKFILKKEQVDICNTPIYKLSVNELNKAVKVCKEPKENKK